MSGVVCGLAMAWLLVDDADVRAIAARRTAAFARHLRQHGMVIHDVDGEPTTYGDLNARIWGVPIGLNAVIALASFKAAAVCANDDAFADAYRDLLENDYADIAYWAKFQLFGKTNHNNDDMQFLATLPLLFLEGDAALRAKYVRGVERTWAYVSREGNAWFNYAAMLAFGYDRQAAADARLQLENFPIDKRSFEVDLREDPRFEHAFFTTRKGELQSPYPLPVNYREQTVFAWRDDPYALRSGERARGDEIAAPVDYLLAYWLGRYVGFLDARD
jgi:hypothetical protein